MSAYSSYMKAIGNDLRQIAVWEPGNKVNLGDYGEFSRHYWQRLGSVWDLIPDADPSLRQSSMSLLSRVTLGNWKAVSEQTDADLDGTPAQLGLRIQFSKGHSVFVRADNCETRTLKNAEAIAKIVTPRGRWRKGWRLVTEVCSAREFVVLIAEEEAGELRVTAQTTELLEAFTSGSVNSNAGIQISGAAALQFVGQTGPIFMSLVKIKSPWLLRAEGKIKHLDYAEAEPTALPISIEQVKADDALAELFAPVA